MNVKQITRALHTLSLLSEEDYDLVLKLRALTEDERGMLMLVLEPLKPAGKKASKKSSKSSSSQSSSHESPRAIRMAAQLNKRREQERAGATPTHCYATIDDNGGEMTCGKPEDDPVHDMTYLSSHPFARDARPATTRSPANGGVESTTQNSEASAVSAQAATAGLSSED